MNPLYQRLVNAAGKAMRHAWAPYSRFKVGAALLTADGKIYTGANVENASYGLSLCAERVALFKAVSEGERRFTAIAVVSSPGGDCAPCGACRQVLREFGNDIEIVFRAGGDYTVMRIDDLLPHAFSPGGLGKEHRRCGK